MQEGSGVRLQNPAAAAGTRTRTRGEEQTCRHRGNHLLTERTARQLTAGRDSNQLETAGDTGPDGAGSDPFQSWS